MTEKQNIEIAAKVIRLLRRNGIKCESPYDVENWSTEYLENHTSLFKTYCFEPVMPVTPERVALLRHQTGAGLMLCRRALNDAEGDMEAAKEIVKEHLKACL